MLDATTKQGRALWAVIGLAAGAAVLVGAYLLTKGS